MEMRKLHQELFGQEATMVVRAPGRINIIGEHIDYHQGLVLPAAVEQCLQMTYGASLDDQTKVYSSNYEEWYLEGDSVPDGSWKKYIEGIHAIAAREGLSIRPYHAAIHSDLPTGAGMSSSAALCCGLISALNLDNDWDLDRLEIALFAQAVEHDLGVMCGLMDQYAVLFGQRDQVILLDCQRNEHDYVQALLGSYKIILLHSGVNHALVDSAYNDRRKTSEEALLRIHEQFPQVSSYRDVNHEMIARATNLTAQQAPLA
ncbi:MAG: hypothetical protein KTR24_13605, partial [Saprospiraceae bacterium]|nr:hypothetical protein [Saprospiraceae bacterium]